MHEDQEPECLKTLDEIVCRQCNPQEHARMFSEEMQPMLSQFRQQNASRKFFRILIVAIFASSGAEIEFFFAINQRIGTTFRDLDFPFWANLAKYFLWVFHTESPICFQAG
jgi:hypothetical protein